MPRVSWDDFLVCLYGAGGAILLLVIATWLATRNKNKSKNKDEHEN